MNCPSSCANHTAGFSGQKGGMRILTRSSVNDEDESGGCSGQVERSASCCIVYHVGRQVFRSLRGHQCGGIGMYFLTHTIHTQMHNCMCTQHYFSAYTHCLYWPLVCCCTEIASHTDTLQLPLNSQLLSVFIRLRCMDDKLSWLRGWSSARCSPQVWRKIHIWFLDNAEHNPAWGHE